MIISLSRLCDLRFYLFHVLFLYFFFSSRKEDGPDTCTEDSGGLISSCEEAIHEFVSPCQSLGSASVESLRPDTDGAISSSAAVLLDV